MRTIQTALCAFALLGTLLATGCTTSKNKIPSDLIDLAPGRTDRAFIQMSVKAYASKYMTEVMMLRGGQKLERVGLIGIGRRDSTEFFKNQLEAKVMQIMLAVPPGKHSFLLRSYDMPKDNPFQVSGEAGKITPVLISKEATERSYLYEPLDRRWNVEVMPSVLPDP